MALPPSSPSAPPAWRESDVALYAGDRGPSKSVSMVIGTTPVAGTSVVSVVMKVRRPNGSELTWSPSITASTASSVTVVQALASDGSSLPLEGTYYVRAWCYDAGGALLLDTDESSFTVAPSRHSWP